jgi:hypothetical protein
MRSSSLRSNWVLVFLLLCGCEGASSQSGVTAYFRIQGAQYVPGEIDLADRTSAPEVVRIDSQANKVYPGIMGKSVGGSVGPGSVSVLIGLVGDRGHWILSVQAADSSSPGDFIFSGKASFSPDIPMGPAELVYRAVNATGDVGPPETQSLTVQATAVEGGLVISLDWDTEADLDLRVTAPDANGKEVEIWSRKQSTLIEQSQGDPALTSDELKAALDAAGRLDFDSNSQCQIDGRRQENIYWVVKPPATQSLYSIRVDTFSMCSEVLAHWRVRVLLDGQEAFSAEGQVGDADSRFDHGPGAGLLALEFTY